ncbi:MAG: hypothetical protein ABW007_06635 [Chitinophagaceae bacterium]
MIDSLASAFAIRMMAWAVQKSIRQDQLTIQEEMIEIHGDCIDYFSTYMRKDLSEDQVPGMMKDPHLYPLSCNQLTNLKQQDETIYFTCDLDGSDAHRRM